jgi:predicted secreted protein
MITIKELKANITSIDQALNETSDLSYAFSLLVQEKSRIQSQLRMVEQVHLSTSCTEETCLGALVAHRWDVHEAVLDLYKEYDGARPMDLHGLINR